MPLVSAVAASHAPNILMEPGAEWDDFMRLHYRMAPHRAESQLSHEVQQDLRRDAEKAFAALRGVLDASHPEILIVVANDQFVNFFFNNIPTFFVSLNDEVYGRFTRHRFHYRNHRDLGRGILKGCLDKGIDLSFGENVKLQHTQLVPLHFLLPEASIPVLAFYVNTWVAPLPTPRRCYQVGQVMREVADARAERIAILATGGLSHFPGSARIGEIETEFDLKLLQIMREGQGQILADYSLDEFLNSGNSEFLNWMVLLGAVGRVKAAHTFYLPDHVATGWGFASWRL